MIGNNQAKTAQQLGVLDAGRVRQPAERRAVLAIRGSLPPRPSERALDRSLPFRQ